MSEHPEKLRAVFVHTATRLTRNQPELLAILEELDSHGVPVRLVKNQHGFRTRAAIRLWRKVNVLVGFVLSLVGHGNSNTTRNRD